MTSLSATKRTQAANRRSKSTGHLSAIGPGWLLTTLVVLVISLECAGMASPEVPQEWPSSEPTENPVGSGEFPSSPNNSPTLAPDAAEAKLQASKVPLAIAFAGLALYSLIGLLTLVAMIFPPQRATPTRQSQIVQRLFSVLVIIFCLIRLVYFCLPIAHVSVTVTYIINQLAFTVFFTMFSLIIFFWAEQYHRKFFDTQSMLPRLQNIFIGTNAILWIVEIVLVTVACILDQVPKDKLTNDPSAPTAPQAPSSISPIVTVSQMILSDTPSMTGPATPVLTPSTSTKGASLGGPLYFASVILIIVVDSIFALGFAIYGIAIFVQKYNNALGSGLRRELIQTMLVTIVFGACFALRMGMFLYRPITGKFMNPVVYRVLAYFVPEVVAVLLQVSVVYLMNHTAGNPAGWKRVPRGTGSIQRPSVEDDVYYAADQDLRASAMPAPLANAHQRLISPPRPLRTNFSSGSSVPTVASTNNTGHATMPGVGSAAQSPAHSVATSPIHSASAINPLHSGLPMAIAAHQHTRIGSPLSSSFTPTSFSPGHDQPLALHLPPSDPVLPLQHLDSHTASGRLTDLRDDASDDSESFEVDASDSASLLSPHRKAPKRY